jgi:hypothetical protein
MARKYGFPQMLRFRVDLKHTVNQYRNKPINQVNLKTKAMKAAKVKQVTMIGHHQYGSQGETAYRVVTDTWAGWVIAFGGDYRRATRLEETEITDRIKVNPGTYEEELANGMIGTLVEF